MLRDLHTECDVQIWEHLAFPKIKKPPYRNAAAKGRNKEVKTTGRMRLKTVWNWTFLQDVGIGRIGDDGTGNQIKAFSLNISLGFG